MEKTFSPKEPPNERRYAFFQHRSCEYFPCHATQHPETFNCLFCYCPLYTFGERCGGNFTYLKNGAKDCSGCLFPHRKERYDEVIDKFRELNEQGRQNR
ncbi:cysteine-rich small domain-containing protein [Oscillibacter sp.]|uniref:cysteine-rich small domain-containing protein n=1 Tax=Oscillibacter sp. TaxID=1945593 RepID=UPI0026090702|nr:cysteine-rich small domain-containing protein [Oscillibacter sp.]MDD3347212.1 cysteine-rich small domain-containing protein [Oscillibacter sp.]